MNVSNSDRVLKNNNYKKIYIAKVVNGSHLMGGINQAKNCHHLKRSV
jgi:hypothetical protein